jgi:hypothetical protein
VEVAGPPEARSLVAGLAVDLQLLYAEPSGPGDAPRWSEASAGAGAVASHRDRSVPASPAVLT